MIAQNAPECYIKMWIYINKLLMTFLSCFSNGESFRWFVCVVIGMIVRIDNLGVSSIVRALNIRHSSYESILHFFRAKSWNLSELRKVWIRIVMSVGLLYRVDGKPILIGDGVKESKEGRKMAGVKRLAQESENSAKPSFIFGHMFGCVGILLGSVKKLFCTPLSMIIHDGNEIIGK